MSKVNELPDVLAQCRAFINGRSNTWHGDLHAQTQLEKVGRNVCGWQCKWLWVFSKMIITTIFRCGCVYNSIPCHVFDLPLMKVLHWAETFDNSLTVDTGLQFWLVNSQLSIISTPSHTENFADRGFTSLWMTQESRRHLLEVWGQELIMLASSQLMDCTVQCE